MSSMCAPSHVVVFDNIELASIILQKRFYRLAVILVPSIRQQV